MQYENNEYLMHHGVKGQKWGVRRYQNEDGTWTEEGLDRRKKYADNYSKEQRDHDRKVYGKPAVARINRKMLNGAQISSARSEEATRIEGFSKAATLGGAIGSTTGKVAGIVGGVILSKKIAGSKLVRDFVSKNGQLGVAAAMAGAAAISAGASEVGTLLGRWAGQDAVMLSGGYNPRKRR